MKYGLLFSLIAVSLSGLALTRGGWSLLLLYPAISFAVVASGYLGLGAAVFGKRTDGTIAWTSALVLMPYLIYLTLIWSIMRLVTAEPPFHRVSDDLWVGRRLLGAELPPNMVSVLDLTCEFVEPKTIRGRAGYRCFPILDGSTRDVEDIRQVVQSIDELPKPILIHCAQGHGRTGLIAASYLIITGRAETAEDAVARLKQVRPQLGLNDEQMRCLARLAE